MRATDYSDEPKPSAFAGTRNCGGALIQAPCFQAGVIDIQHTAISVIERLNAQGIGDFCPIWLLGGEPVRLNPKRKIGYWRTSMLHCVSCVVFRT